LKKQRSKLKFEEGPKAFSVPTLIEFLWKTSRNRLSRIAALAHSKKLPRKIHLMIKTALGTCRVLRNTLFHKSTKARSNKRSKQAMIIRQLKKKGKKHLQARSLRRIAIVPRASSGRWPIPEHACLVCL
jgi:hypothetical protein